MTLLIQTFIESPLSNNNYVVIDPQSKEAILIDCSAYNPAVLDYIGEKGATLKYILITHTHFDHILGVNEMMKKHAVPAFANAADFPLLKDMNGWLSQMGYPRMIIPDIKPLPDNLKLGNIPITVIQTPGHTPGGVCYLIQNHLFSGDTLFKGTYGRTDIPMSNPATMRTSLQNLVNQLPEDTFVYPGHGLPTTIAAEKDFYS